MMGTLGGSISTRDYQTVRKFYETAFKVALFSPSTKRK